jgi:hypothetical protein
MNKTMNIRSAEPMAPAKTHLSLLRVIKAANEKVSHWSQPSLMFDLSRRASAGSDSLDRLGVGC